MAEWYIRAYTCDNGIEYKTKFPVSENISSTKSRKKKSACIARAERCATDAAHELGRLLNCNFITGTDFHIVLTYSDKGLAALRKKTGAEETELLIRQAKREYDNCMKRVKYRAEKKTVEIKAAAVISITDPETGEAVRIHHHVVINADAASLFAECWRAGDVRMRRLYSNNGPDLQELADYMIAQAARVGADKRYTHTRNLNRAEVSRPIKARNPAAELKVPRECKEIWRSEYKPGKPQHIRYYRPPAAPNDIRQNKEANNEKNGLESESAADY